MIREDYTFILQANEKFAAEELSLIEIPESLQPAIASRQEEFRRGRWCAQQALAKWNCKESIGQGQKREPLWPSGFVGAISHCKAYSCALVARSKSFRGVGVDIEEIGRIREGMERLILLSEEKKFSMDWQKSLIFSAKESLYKMLFPIVQEFFGFLDAQIITIEQNSFQIKLLKNFSPMVTSGEIFIGEYSLFDQHVLVKMFWPI